MDLDKNKEEYWIRCFPDLQEAKVFTRCYFTGLDIYEGERCIILADGQYIKYDIDVLTACVGAEIITAGEENC